MLRFVSVVVVLLLLVTACSPVSPAAQPTQIPPTPTPITVSITPSPTPSSIPTNIQPSPVPTNTPENRLVSTATSIPPQSTPVVQGEDCGKIQMLGPNPPTDPSALQSENCFWQAFQECRGATLTVIQQRVDSGTSSIFTIQKIDQCTISDTEQTYFVPRPPQNAKTYTCAGLSRKEGGLLFQSCGTAGDIFVPPPPSP